MLTGQGADEYLGGYRRYVAGAMLSRLGPFRKAALSLGCALVPRRLPGRFNAVVRRINRVRSLLGQDRDERILGLYTWAGAQSIAGLFADPLPSRVGAGMLDLYQQNIHLGEAEALMRVDHAYDLMSLNLTYCDRMSMAAGVEARVPFLDFDLVQLMNGMPEHMKIRQNEGKYVLKQLMEGRLPRDVIYREKAGFGLPLRAWLRSENELVAGLLNPVRIRRDGIFNPQAIQALCQAQFRGAADNANVLFSLLCFQLWLDSEGGTVH
jgi:asparagine synthase (glutamine-hydrolysing)